MSYRGFANEDEYEDARQEARADEWADNATECAWCGCLWDEGYHPATRMQPAEVDHPECPRCGMAPEEAAEAVKAHEDGGPRSARLYGQVLIHWSENPRTEPIYYAIVRDGKRVKSDSWTRIKKLVREAEGMEAEPTSAPYVLLYQEEE